MTPTRLRWAVIIALVAAATIAIHYEVKVRLRAAAATGSVQSIGRLAVGDGPSVGHSYDDSELRRTLTALAREP